MNQEPLSSNRTHKGKIATSTVISAAVGALPVPWLPEKLEAWVRASLVRGLAEAHGVRLTREVADVLVQGVSVGYGEQILRALARAAMLRLFARVGPLALFFAARDALTTLVLGSLFDHYLANLRGGRGPLDRAEAERVRKAMDRAFTRPWKAIAKGGPGGPLTRLERVFVEELLG
jgi:uncharacterized protein (DUF697 family)